MDETASRECRSRNSVRAVASTPDEPRHGIDVIPASATTRIRLILVVPLAQARVCVVSEETGVAVAAPYYYPCRAGRLRIHFATGGSPGKVCAGVCIFVIGRGKPRRRRRKRLRLVSAPGRHVFPLRHDEALAACRTPSSPSPQAEAAQSKTIALRLLLIIGMRVGKV